MQSPYVIHFAPLQGYTDCTFRNAFANYFGGVEAYYTPFIRIEKGQVRMRDQRDIDPLRNTVPCLIPQILPGSPEEFRFLAAMLREKGYRKADINLGCPFPLIAGKRKGAGMLPYPNLVKEVLETTFEFPDIAFSVKMRLGWENTSECLCIADTINNIRPCHVTVHARTGKQQYKGKPQWEAFEKFYELCQLPLFYNGDLLTRENIQEILIRFPRLRGVSIGRGLLSSPLLAKEFISNETFSEKERMSLCFSFHEELLQGWLERFQDEKQLLLRLKTFWEYFLPATDRKWLKKIKKANSLTLYRSITAQVWSDESV